MKIIIISDDVLWEEDNNGRTTVKEITNFIAFLESVTNMDDRNTGTDIACTHEDEYEGAEV